MKHGPVPLSAVRGFLGRHGLYYKDLAAGIDVTPAYVSLLFRGKAVPTAKLAWKILAYCQEREPRLSFQDLFGVTLDEYAKGAAA